MKLILLNDIIYIMNDKIKFINNINQDNLNENKTKKFVSSSNTNPILKAFFEFKKENKNKFTLMDLFR